MHDRVDGGHVGLACLDLGFVLDKLGVFIRDKLSLLFNRNLSLVESILALPQLSQLHVEAAAEDLQRELFQNFSLRNLLAVVIFDVLVGLVLVDDLGCGRRCGQRG